MDPDMLIKAAEGWLTHATVRYGDNPLTEERSVALAQAYALLAVYARLDQLCDRLDALATRFAL